MRGLVGTCRYCRLCRYLDSRNLAVASCSCHSTGLGCLLWRRMLRATPATGTGEGKARAKAAAGSGQQRVGPCPMMLTTELLLTLIFGSLRPCNSQPMYFRCPAERLSKVACDHVLKIASLTCASESQTMYISSPPPGTGLSSLSEACQHGGLQRSGAGLNLPNLDTK
jgi:hypothetical protein